MILAAAWSSPDAGFAFYGTNAPPYDALAGDILSYFSYLLICAGAAALLIGIRGNWANSESALAANTALVVLVEIGLIVFLLMPGHLGLTDALPGFVLAAIGIVVGGIACRPAQA